ncbi:hypothetical protein SAMN05216464_103315 [Mucilaginibacter pineti]|uniref:Uncharacterized protein n=1 Tax=Mucilaginibacter pineti TaxID=1391627 RepID=A0A1G6ZE60_9SPHI|nr:hypothetical protein [Mucilaginibacter pineti]SDE00762.1 hypothetical protein SAMN05216464_103315 [Mucilaginibacter pineti]
MKLLDTSILIAKKLYPVKYNLRGQLPSSYTDVFDQRASDLIKSKLAGDAPLMVSRLGSIELNCILNYVNQKKSTIKYFEYITGKIDAYKWKPFTFSSMCTAAGFFPGTPEMLAMFGELMLNDMAEIDVLGSWLKEEVLFSDQLKNSTKVGLLNLEPYNHENPWSQELEGKTILVIHPYEESITSQYKKREYLFADKRVLPNFELKTIKAVQTISNNKSSFQSWFQALDYMKERIYDTSFDVAIIGCGAYGLPLAAYVKRMGKKAIHLGGATQLLFGIKGKRWEDNYLDYKERLINEYWVKPNSSEVPENFQAVEQGCYW